jgi:hypothetical protein
MEHRSRAVTISLAALTVSLALGCSTVQSERAATDSAAKIGSAKQTRTSPLPRRLIAFGEPRVLVRTQRPISKFSQDGPFLAWEELQRVRGTGTACGALPDVVAYDGLIMRDRVGRPVRKVGPACGGECTVGTADTLAVASGAILWSVNSDVGHFQRCVLVSARSRHRYLIDELSAEASDPSPPTVRASTGNGRTLIYSKIWTEPPFDPDCDPSYENCLTSLKGAVLAVDFASAGGLRQLGAEVRAADLAASNDRIALVRMDGAIEIRNARTGDSVDEIQPAHPAREVALSRNFLASLTGIEKKKTTLEFFDAMSLERRGTLDVRLAAQDLSIAGDKVVFRVGREIRLVDATALRSRRVATAARRPIGLSIEGNRIAWAESSARGGRIRATVGG